jgi:ornithine cyclodeaminase/alanine dehydrogenase-like protein (mu-crystallin family)
MERRVKPPLILHDRDVESMADMRDLVGVLREFFLAVSKGETESPPRHAVEFGPAGRLVFTIGGSTAADAGFAGFRVYDTFGDDGSANAQLVAIWNLSDGKLEGLILGPLLGAIRTGAIGGVAIDLLTRADAKRCGVIGTGVQAETQLQAAVAMRPGIESVFVFSRSPEKRESFARKMSLAVSRQVVAASSAQQASEGADLLICATDSRSPVVELGWCSPGVHINTVGSRSIDAHEMPAELGECVAICATDSLEQIAALPKRHFLDGTHAGRHMVELSQLVAGDGPARRPLDITLFCSVGVSGSEVAVGSALLRKHRNSDPIARSQAAARSLNAH